MKNYKFTLTTICVLMFAVMSLKAQSISKFADKPKTPSQVAAWLNGGSDADFNVSREAYKTAFATELNAANKKEVFWKVSATDSRPYVFKASEMPYVIAHYTTYKLQYGDVNGAANRWVGVTKQGTFATASKTSCEVSKGLKTPGGIDLTKDCCGGQTRSLKSLNADLGIGAPKGTDESEGDEGAEKASDEPSSVPAPAPREGRRTFGGLTGISGNIHTFDEYVESADLTLAIQEKTLKMNAAHTREMADIQADYATSLGQVHESLIKAACECCGMKGCGGDCDDCRGGNNYSAPAQPQQVSYVQERDGAAKFHDVATGIGSLAQGTGMILGGVGLLKIGQKYQPTQVNTFVSTITQGTNTCGNCHRPIHQWDWSEHDHNHDGQITGWDIGTTGNNTANWDIGTTGNGLYTADSYNTQNQNAQFSGTNNNAGWNFAEGQQGQQNYNTNNNVPGFGANQTAMQNFLPAGARMW